MKNRILSLLLTASLLLGSSPIASAAETQAQKYPSVQETLPFTFMDTTENINDDRVKGHCIQITDEDENWKTIEHFGSNLFYYSVKAISAISAPSYSDPSAYVDQLYAVCNPETQSYDIYNAATGEYHDYRLDEVPSCFRNSKGDSAGVFRIVKNKKIGIMDASDSKWRADSSGSAF